MILITSKLVLDLPREEPRSLTADLIVLRRTATKGIDGIDGGGSITQQLDNWSGYVNGLLRCYYGGEIRDEVVEMEIVYSVLQMSCRFEELAQELVERAYCDGGEGCSSEAWRSSTSMGKRAIGLTEFLIDTGIAAKSPEMISVVNAYMQAWTLSQQVRVVILTISKLHETLIKQGSKYDDLLTLQESDLETLSSHSAAYGKLALGCHQLCRQLEVTELAEYTRALSTFLNILSLVLFSMDRYNKNECGVALGMLEEATSKLLKANMVSREYLMTLKDGGLRQRTKSKLLNWQRKIKNKSAKTFARQVAGLHPFLKQVLQDFLVPLVILLQYRFQKSNDSVFMQPVEGRWQLPQGKVPDPIGIQWVFDGELRETSETNRYF